MPMPALSLEDLRKYSYATGFDKGFISRIVDADTKLFQKVFEAQN